MRSVAAVVAVLGLLAGVSVGSAAMAGPASVPSTAWAWGSNLNGQLGNGNSGAFADSLTPVQVCDINCPGPLSGITAIAAGANHSLGLKSDGTVLGWGANSSGQLGNGTATDSPKPIQVSGLAGVTAIAGGISHSLALKSDGTVWAWGDNVFGQLGYGPTGGTSLTPVQVSGLGVVIAVAAGGYFSLALKSDGTVLAWGNNLNGQLGRGTDINTGQGFSPTPALVCDISCPGPLSGVTAIAGGGSHGLARKSDGTVWAWGANGVGQLGHVTTNNWSNKPVQVTGLDGVTAIAAGASHSLALKDGNVWAWGSNDSGQLGNGTTLPGTWSFTPVRVCDTTCPGALSGVMAIAGGNIHTLALKSDGTGWGWGYNASGQLGDGTSTISTTPVQVSGLAGATAISAGANHSLAATSTLTVVNSLVPNGGPTAGGTSVTITGINFTGATAVTFGAAPATTFVVNTATQITATSPAGFGIVDVTVTTPGGTSPISAGDKFTFGTPSAPTGVQAVAGDTEATLTWTPPANGSPITTYTVTASPGGMTTAVSPVVPAATVTGLTNGTPYTFTVTATNAVGTGPASAASAAVTPTAVAQGPSVVVLPTMLNGAYGGYLTTAYLENISASPAHIRVQYFDTNGAAVGTGNSVAGLVAGATWTLRTDNGHSLAALQAGTAIVYSDQALAAFVNEFAANNTDASSYTGIAIPSGTGTTLYAPAIFNGAYGGYFTGIGLVNLSSSLVNITVTYRDNAGTVAKVQTLTGVAGGAFQSLYSGDVALALPTNFAGTATITSSGGNLAAVVNEVGPGNQFSSYDAVPAGSTTLYAPAAMRNAYGGFNTGMSFQNTTGTPGTVTITYYDINGTATVTSYPIVANGYLAVYQGTDIPVDGAYTAKITSTVAIAAEVNEVAPLVDPNAQQFTAYNPFAAGSSSLHLPLVESNGADGWSTGANIMNTGTAATTVTVTYYDTFTGLQVGTPQTLSVQPNAIWGLYQPTGGLPNGTRASAVVTTTAGGQVGVVCNASNATSLMSYNGI